MKSKFRKAVLTLSVLISVSLLVYFASRTGSVALPVTIFVVACMLYLQHLFAKPRIEKAIQAERAANLELQIKADVYLRTIESLAVAIDAKDQTSQGHVRRTVIYATELGKLLNVTPYEHEALIAGAMLHDIGKLAVPEYILNKPGDLTKAESARMRIHPTVGGDILSRVNFPYPVEEIVRCHHEHWDGTGYPKGLKGEQIPLVARIISVVDFYDSTRCDRPYRAGMTREDSLALLDSMSGLAFDPTVVKLFVNNLDEFDRLISSQDLQEQVESIQSREIGAERRAAHVQSGAEEISDRNPGSRSIADAQKEVFALHEIAQSIGSSLSLHDTVSIVANRLRGIVPFDTCIIYLVDEKSGHALPVHALGTLSRLFANRRVRIGEGLTGKAIYSNHTICSSDPEVHLLRIHKEIAAQFKHALVTPLRNENGAFGAMTLYSTEEPYTIEHVRLIETVSQYASGALNNALTFEKTKESALLDSLTQLPNARAFHMALEQRVAESQRQNNREPIAVMSMDLDQFRQVNESHGHAFGDHLLTSVAKVIKRQLRRMDILSRYSGDEFAAILPMASHKTAFLIAERIQRTVEKQKFSSDNERTIEIGISIGIAYFPDDGETAERLLAVARQNREQDKLSREMENSVLEPTVTRIESYR